MELEQAFVLHTRPYRDTSLLVDLFTYHSGLVTVVARSARGLKSRFQGQLQLFKPLLIAWSGRNELKSLVRLESDTLPYHLTGRALMCGFYINELLLRLLDRQEPLSCLFNAYQLVLKSLVDNVPGFAGLRYFEVQLLEEVGYGVSFCHDAKTGGMIQSDKVYCYEHQLGFYEASSDVGNTFQGSTLIKIKDSSLTDMSSQAEAKLVMRYILSFYLGGRPLKSREMFY